MGELQKGSWRLTSGREVVLGGLAEGSGGKHK